MTIKLLKDIVYISDGNYSSKYPRNDEFVTKGIPFIRANNLVDNTVVDYDMLFISQEKHKELKKGHLKTNDVLLTTRGNIGRVSIVPDKYNDANINAQIVLLRCDKNIILPSYLLYCLQSDFCQRQMEKLETGTALKQLPVGRLSDLRINVVPIKEQEKIVKRLCVADSIIRNHKTLLDNSALLVKSRFIEMFGDPVQNTLGWPIKTLGDISSLITNGNTPKGGSQNYVEDGILFLRSQNVWRNRIDLEDVAYITKEIHDSLKKSSLHNKDILITKTGRVNTENSSLGRAALFLGKDNSANINGHVYLVRLKDGVIPEFVLSILIGEEYRRYIRKVCVGGIDKRQINLDQVEDFPIILPPLQMQQSFVDFIAQVDKSKLAVQQSLKELETLKKSLMQQYFG